MITEVHKVRKGRWAVVTRDGARYQALLSPKAREANPGCSGVYGSLRYVLGVAWTYPTKREAVMGITWALREIESRPGMSNGSRATLLALVALVHYHQWNGTSAEEIARVTGEPVRWVRAHLRWLATTGIREDRTVGIYRLPAEALEETGVTP